MTIYMTPDQAVEKVVSLVGTVGEYIKSGKSRWEILHMRRLSVEYPWCGDYGCFECKEDVFAAQNLYYYAVSPPDYLDARKRTLIVHLRSIALFRYVIGEEAWENGRTRELFIVRNGKAIFGVSREGKVVAHKRDLDANESPDYCTTYQTNARCYQLASAVTLDCATAVALNLKNLNVTELERFLGKGGRNKISLRKYRTSDFSNERPIVKL